MSPSLTGLAVRRSSLRRFLGPLPSRGLPRGGAEGSRTPDPLLAGQVLFHLSYNPRFPVPQNRTTRETFPFVWVFLFPNGRRHFSDAPVLHRKEVIQPHLPIRLPCYDLTPIIESTFGCCLLAVSSQTSGVPNFHGLTGGVYKARERIHRGMLIRDY